MDAEGRVIYVGKARQLRARLSSYFQDARLLHTRTRSMLESARSVDWTVVGTEVEALQLEYSWIKEFDPRFNVKYRDDKSYPYLAVTVSEEIPRAQVLRGTRRKGVRYFGPYSHAWAIRDTLDQLLRVFPIRTCSAGVFRRAKASGRPCLLGYIDKCSAPCIGRVTPDEHRALVDELCRFLAGDATPFIRERERAMQAAAAVQDFERAARLRDQMQALERALERNAVVLAPGTDADIIGLHEDELEAAVQVFFVRDGRIRGRRGWVTERVEDLDRPGLVEHFLQQVYAERADDLPREVLVPVLPSGADTVAGWLSQLRGSNVELRVPRRGDKRELLATVGHNAHEAFVQHRLRRSSDLTARSVALQELQEALDLPESPLRIECIDVSHLGGDDIVASLVVFEDGAARKSDYRRFALRDQQEADDVRSIREVVTRRFTRYLEEQADAAQLPIVDGRPRAFAYRPQLLVIDGGPAQAAAAQSALVELGVEGIAVVGLAKRLEEVWPAGSADPVILARGSEGLYLLQRIRDEAHRFAGAYQRTARSKRVTAGALDRIDGLGPARKAALLKSFGSVKRVRAAEAADLQVVPGIGPELAQRIVTALHADEGSSGDTTARGAAINTATGEIMDA
jgi:excinuclease ABC subunit C